MQWRHPILTKPQTVQRCVSISDHCQCIQEERKKIQQCKYKLRTNYSQTTHILMLSWLLFNFLKQTVSYAYIKKCIVTVQQKEMH